VHYLTAEEWEVHDTLCCISMGKLKDDGSRIHYSRELSLKSPQEMIALFADCPEAVENTVRIGERCQVELELGVSHVPMVRIARPVSPPRYDGGDLTEWFQRYCAQYDLVPYDTQRDGGVKAEQVRRDCDEALRNLCAAGLVWRYGADGVTEEIRSRLDRELRILSEKLISAYFLIVWDFVNWARQRGIPANARGSGVGTMVGYVLGLSNACPVHYGLLFERFTDPDRSEFPDIDVDICQDGRAAVINHVREKYGHVAQIITFGRLKARAAIKDVARVYGLSPAEGQRLANLVPSELNIRLDAALEKEPDLKAQYDNDPMVRRVIDAARALEDHARHSGVHAAGVVIATQPLDTIVPLCRATRGEDIVTQWDGPTCEQVGLLKMDFLGLRTLSTIERACRLIRQTLPDEAIWAAVGKATPAGPHPLDLDRLSYDDQRVFDLFRRSDTAGVFQFESGGMRKLLAQMQPDRIEDLIAANALFRPGPMDLIPEYCARKHGRQPVPHSHPIVDRYTRETYGIMVYQEQVMQIVHSLGDIPLRRAYTLIKAISKKKHSVIDSERPRFIAGAAAQGLNATEARQLFDLILKFASYGFNKSHSTGYAIIAYQTAYLKTYFPNQYMAAMLTYESGARKVDEWAGYLNDCRQTVFPDSTPRRPHVGVEVRPPDINASEADFTIAFAEDEPHDALHGHVRFGLGAIKNIGTNAVQAIIAERSAHGPFLSLFDFCERVSPRSAGKAIVESLVKCGAFDSLHGTERRAAVFAAIDDAIAAGHTAAEDRRVGQLSFFGGESTAGADAAPSQRPLPACPPWERITMLEHEKQVLGFHVSGHPLDDYETVLRRFATATAAGVGELTHDAPVVVGGILSRVRFTVARRGKHAGQKMAMISLQDRSGVVDGVVFASVFARCGRHLQTEGLVLVRGRVDLSLGEPQIIVDEVFPMEDAERRFTRTIEIDLDEHHGPSALSQQMELLCGLLQQASAARVVEEGRPASVLLHIHTGGKRVTLRCNRYQIVASPPVLTQIRELVGAEHVRTMGGALQPPARGRSAAGSAGRNGILEEGRSDASRDSLVTSSP
jgi:DNA polymerase-3 subunit alpha